ncbi:hypothetical protein G9A89_008241 [Geosiphon pyriformis]|nr:hypothetical protein G9A89_008241 [Geosiphon pyriformis]
MGLCASPATKSEAACFFSDGCVVAAQIFGRGDMIFVLSFFWHIFSVKNKINKVRRFGIFHVTKSRAQEAG